MSRESILANIKSGKPAWVELPDINLNEIIQYENNLGKFKTVLQSIGGTFSEVHSETELHTIIQEQTANKKFAINNLNAIDDSLIKLTSNELQTLDVAILKGEVAIAENAAIWVPEKNMGNRLVPFICNQLVLVIHQKNIVATMHQAYEMVYVNEDGFGVFIAGPSKTADIEQSLVIGAHGAMGLNVIILKN